MCAQTVTGLPLPGYCAVRFDLSNMVIALGVTGTRAHCRLGRRDHNQRITLFEQYRFGYCVCTAPAQCIVVLGPIVHLVLGFGELVTAARAILQGEIEPHHAFSYT